MPKNLHPPQADHGDEQTIGGASLDKEAFFVRIRERSLFSHFPDESCEALLQEASLVSVDAGSSLDRPPAAAEIWIVADGAIELLTPADLGSPVDVITWGRSLELESAMSGEPWKYIWRAKSRTAILRIPMPSVLRELDRDPSLREYLKRIVTYPELQRFKNEIRLFGLPAELIAPTIRSLTALSAAELDGDLASIVGVAIVGQGELNIHARIDGARHDIGHFLPGDYFIWGLEQNFELKIELSEGARVWWLSIKDWIAATRTQQITFLIRFIDPMGRRLAQLHDARQARYQDEQKAKLLERASDEEPEGDAVDGDPNDFLCDEQELKTLWKKSPKVVKQHDEMDCGPAALASVALHYGRRISIPILRALVNVTRDGSSMLSVRTAARKIGFRADAFQVDYDEARSLRVPFIALCDYHFVVVYKVGEKWITLGDPSVGLRIIHKAEFIRIWGKNALGLIPTARFFSFPESLVRSRDYLPLLRGRGRSIAEIVCAGLLSFVLGLSVPVFTQIAFDWGVSGASSRALHLLGITFTILGVLAVLVTWARGSLTYDLAIKIDAYFSSVFLGHAFRLPLQFFAVRRVGDITSRLNGLRQIRAIVTDHAIEIGIGLVGGIVYAGVLALYNGALLIPFGIFLVGFFLTTAILLPRGFLAENEAEKAAVKLNSVAFEQAKGLTTIRALGAGVAARWRWELCQQDYLRARRRAELMLRATASTCLFLAQLAITGCLLTGVYLYMSGRLTVGQLIASTAIMSGVMAPFLMILARSGELNQSVVQLARVDDVMRSPGEHDLPNSGSDPGFDVRGEIEFREVGFRYSNDQLKWPLRGIQLKINAGERVAFVGPSGSGKTTLGYLINLLYAPSEGVVLIDGRNATELPLDLLRTRISLIIQENSIFSGTILENIAIGDPNPSFSKVVAAARLADAHDFISALSDGYSTHLGEGGQGISGGQAQKLNIARALYRDPAILIMDEATSALDAISEENILTNLKASAKAKTMVIIAHRLNTIVSADRIVVLKNGQIVESGTHVELIKVQGDYYQLFKDQMTQ